MASRERIERPQKIAAWLSEEPEAPEVHGNVMIVPKHGTKWHHSIAIDNVILLAEVGSSVTGVPRKEDTDQTGVCIEPLEVITGINAMGQPLFEQYEYHSTGDEAANRKGDLDLTIYGLRKFARMAANGAPTALIPLFVPQNAYEVSTPAGADLRAKRDMFVTKAAGLRFAGLAKRQREMLEKKGKGRKDLVSQHGYDTDYAYHGLRALIQGIELMSWGSIALPMADYRLDYLRKVRTGRYTYKQVLKDFGDYGQQLADAIKMSKLPSEPNWAQINQWLAFTYQQHWEGNR